ncbi:MAG: MTAP family purine nucleoside phosphorylase [Pseudomonadota bacterium]
MLAIIGGSGLYELDGLEKNTQHNLDTPFGQPSSPIFEGVYEGQKVFFLARHGLHHQFLPHEINYRANIFSLKKLGVRQIFSLSAAGSLNEKIKPGGIATVSQYFDHTRGKRVSTFFGNGVAAHISTAYPTCNILRSDIEAASKRAGLNIFQSACYACVEGPRLGTRAESFFLRDQAKCDLVGMTNIPEAFLAREAQMAYCTLALITDYDCWMDDPKQHVSVELFLKTYAGTLEKAKSILAQLLKTPLSPTPREISHALESAILTPFDQLTNQQKEWLDILRA